MIELREEADGRAVPKARRPYAHHGHLPLPSRHAGRLRDRARRRRLERRADRSLGCGGRRHGPEFCACRGRLPGLYIIQTRMRRRAPVSYWRDTAAARLLFHAPEAESIVAALSAYGADLLSGHLPVALRRQRAGAPVRGAGRRRAPTAGAWPSTPISARADGPTGTSRVQPSARPSLAPTSFSPPPKTSTCCSATMA